METAPLASWADSIYAAFGPDAIPREDVDPWPQWVEFPKTGRWLRVGLRGAIRKCTVCGHSSVVYAAYIPVNTRYVGWACGECDPFLAFGFMADR